MSNWIRMDAFTFAQVMDASKCHLSRKDKENWLCSVVSLQLALY